MAGNVSYENLSDSLKQKIEESNVEIVNDLTTGGADKALSAEQGKVIKTELDKTLKANTYNANNVETNLGTTSAKKSFGNFIFTNDTTSEFVAIDFNSNVIFGMMRVTLSSTYANKNASGGAEVIFHIGVTDGNVHRSEMDIISMPKEFAETFYIQAPSFANGKLVFAVYKRKENSPITIDIEFYSTHGNAWTVLADTTIRKSDVGSVISTPIQQSIFTHVGNSKQDLATAITGKGVPTTADDTFAKMVANINAIQSGNIALDIITATASSNAEAFTRASGGGSLHSVFVDIPVEDNSKVITMYGYGYYAANTSGNFVYNANSEGAGIEMYTAKSFITNSTIDLAPTTRHAKCVLFNSKKLIRVPVVAGGTYTVFVVSRIN